MTVLKPWARGPFELILHAEKHLREGGDLYILLLMQFESFCNLGKAFADIRRNSSGS